MNTPLKFFRQSIPIAGRLRFARATVLSLAAFVGGGQSLQAQNEMATAEMTDTAAGGGVYNYSILLQNTGPTTIGTFWYAWIPGQYYLPTAPVSVQPPAGWTYSIVNPGGAGASILYYANSTTTYLHSG
jgi:hypothetical protein